MKIVKAAGVTAPAATEHQLALIHTARPFTFERAHPMRDARCLMCGVLIGPAAVMAIGTAALTGPACPNSCLDSDVFLIHARCLPDNPDGLRTMIALGITCNLPHPWL